MADVAPKVKKVAKPKKPATHPKYNEMVRAAIASLKERGGSSRQAILRYILSHYNVGKDEKAVNTHLKLSLKSGVKKGSLKQAKGTGAAGSFKLGAAAEKPKKRAKSPKKAKKPKVAKPKKVKAKSPAKKAAKKPAAKKVKKSPAKKPAAKKAPAKKVAAKKPKSPKKKAPAKAKARKSPKKAAKK